MKRPQFRLRGLLVVVAVIAIALSIAVVLREGNAPRPLHASDGPFLVLAHTFQGIGAERNAYALARDLRHESGLSTYLYRLDRPRKSSERSARTDRVAVLVGSADTMDAAEQARARLRRIAPTSLRGEALAPVRLGSSVVVANPMIK